MELVEGEDLAQRIAHGAIPLDEALPIAKQIAEALEAAHEQGIIHRDLKPANIKVRPDGTVKVLDFGLAKSMEPTGSAPNVSQPPTITTPAMTQAGIILGTAAYMSPEQARGKPLDKRTDIWAFGCVLYEMLAGRRTFAGDEVSDVLASVLARDPDLTALPAAVPPSIRRLLRRCLDKDRNERLRDIGEARVEIRDALANAHAEVPVGPGPQMHGRAPERLAWIGALTVLAVALAVALPIVFRAPPAASEMFVDITTPPSPSPQSLALSPDGRTIAFVATAEGRSLLWLRSLASGSAQALTGTDGAEAPFWSPDGRSVGFFAGDKIKRLEVDGGSVQTLAYAPSARNGTWSRDNVILFASRGRPIARIPASGGDPAALSGLTRQGSVFSPQFLPDGRHFLYYVRGTPDVRGVYVGQLDDKTVDPRRLLDSETGAVYASSGHVLFVLQGTLFAQPFDPVRQQVTGDKFPLADQVETRTDGEGVSVSTTGSIAYRHRARPQRQFVWFDRSGRELSRVGAPVSTSLSSPSLSGDGQRIVLYRSVNGNPDIWSLDTRRGVLSMLTSDASDDVNPIWSPDGSRIVFSSNRGGVHQLYQKSVASGESEALLLATPQTKLANDWSANGSVVLFATQDPKTRFDLWALPFEGNRKPFPVVQTPSDEQYGQFSPDGKWIAYQSDESGGVELYLQSFPGPGNKWPISTNGGSQVRWRRDGKELFYVAPDGRLMAVPVRLGSNTQDPDVGTPVPLFAPPLGGAGQQGDFRHQYMVSPDGERFLVATVTGEANSPIILILNWKPRP
jgi:Tol biopolymer transport system component